MNWITLTTEAQLSEIDQVSKEQPIVIFKHSTRCPVSSMAKSRLERGAVPSGLTFYYLDLITYRSLSNEIAVRYQVAHESPQILLIRNGECIYEDSHNGIRMEDIMEQAGI